MTNRLDTVDGKVDFIVGIFNFYQPTLSIPEQIALLTLWEASFVLEEEYEMASAIINEIAKIQENPTETPQKIIGSNVGLGKIQKIPSLAHKKIKIPFYVKLFYWFKKLFKHT